MGKEFITTGQVGLRLGVLQGQVIKACNRGLVPHKRCGLLRLFDPADLPAIREGLIKAGYLKDQPEVANVG